MLNFSAFAYETTSLVARKRVSVFLFMVFFVLFSTSKLALALALSVSVPPGFYEPL
jgi:hypothetical protein